MINNKLDLSYLKKAAASLDAVLQACQKDPSNDFLRDASIQRFEFTYELGYKTLKRYLELSEPNAELIDQMAFPNLIRTASEKGLLLNDWSKWSVYRHARNLSSHTYDEKKAVEVFSVIPDFLAEIIFLINKLSERLNSK